MIWCWPTRRPAAAAAHAVRHVRRYRRVHRAAGIAAKAKTIVAWTCIALPITGPLATIPFLRPPLPSVSPGGGPSAGTAIAAESQWAFLPAATGIFPPQLSPADLAVVGAGEMPLAVAVLPPKEGRGGQPIPEPASLALLAAPLAALAVWRMR